MEMPAKLNLRAPKIDLDKSTKHKVTMQDKKQYATSEDPLKFLTAETIANLEECYLTLNPDMKRDDFIKEFITPVISLEVATGDNVLEGLMNQYHKVRENGTSESFKNGPLLISTAYCLQALKELKLNSRENAWAYMAQAKFWHGVVKASLGIEIARTKTIHATHRAKALKGAAGRDETYAVVRQEAFRLAREMVSSEGLWRSASHAAREIQNQVLPFASAHGITLIGDYPEKTIAKWLGGMPDAAELFKTVKPKKAKDMPL